jgi:transcriptional regulator with XRE-family HTH domain
MKQGDVLKKEREKKGLSIEDTAGRLGIGTDEYHGIESGNSPVEDWGFRLAQIAITLETPTSRLLAESGRSNDCKPGQAGELIRRHRERRGRSKAEVAAAMGVSVEEYEKVETGASPIEKYGPLLLAFAEAIEQPVFNLFYPCGLPYQELEDYP